MSVHDNVAFGSDAQVVPADVRAAARHHPRQVQLTGLEARVPSPALRWPAAPAALARALVISPTLLLLDEPLANLDAKLREGRCALRALAPAGGRNHHVYVTHDQAEQW